MTGTEAFPTARRRLPRAWIVAAGVAAALACAGVGAAVALAFASGPAESVAGPGRSAAPAGAPPVAAPPPLASASAQGAPAAAAVGLAAGQTAPELPGASAVECGDAVPSTAQGNLPQPAAAAHGKFAGAAGSAGAAARADTSDDRLRQRLERVLGAKGRVEADRDGGLRLVAADLPQAGAADAIRPPAADAGASATARASGRTPSHHE